MNSPDPAPRYEPEPASAARDTAIDPLVNKGDNLPAPYVGPPAQSYQGPETQPYNSAPTVLPYTGPPKTSYPASGGPYGAPSPVPYTGPPQTGYPPYGPPYGNPPHPYMPPRRTNGLAIGAMITSIIGLFTILICLPVGIGGIVMGHISRGQIRRRGEDGDGFARAGIIIGWVGTGLCLLTITLFFVAPFLLIVLAGPG